MKTPRLSRTLACLVLFALSVGAIAPRALAADPKAPTGRQIAIVVSTLNNPWFVVLAETARDRAKELGYDATIFDSQNDPAKESANFDNIVVSSELPEILALSDRVLVMCEGRKTAEFTRVDATREKILAAALPDKAAA